MNFNLAFLCRFSRKGVFFSVRDLRPFPNISLLIVRLVTLYPDGRISPRSSSRVTIGFWLNRRPNFLDNLRKILIRSTVLFLFSTLLRLLKHAMNELIVIKKNSGCLWYFYNSFQPYNANNLCFFFNYSILYLLPWLEPSRMTSNFRKLRLLFSLMNRN